ncbi:hypothetical protein LIA77_08205 [Sarocladium implicatum]|nr:hypothetical protein LIA77_08205 [Sarocladium implicatum]
MVEREDAQGQVRPVAAFGALPFFGGRRREARCTFFNSRRGSGGEVLCCHSENSAHLVI